ncbi:MAG: response regulator [Congregibacter sp.]
MEKILFVDDEVELLEFYQDVFSLDYAVATASSAAEGIETLREDSRDFVLVVSDMSMPVMDGIEFLSKARKIAPDAVRVMLTGNPSESVVVDAVNRGDIFKFITKPASIETLTDIVRQGTRQYRLARAERDLLEQTFKGTVEILIEALSLANPALFGLAQKQRDYVIALAHRLEEPVSWELETAALLASIGALTLPDEIIRKFSQSLLLTQEEKQAFKNSAREGFNLLNKVPRLGGVAELVLLQHKNFDGSGLPADVIARGAEIPVGARIMHVVVEYFFLRASGVGQLEAAGQLRRSEQIADPDIADALVSFLRDAKKQAEDDTAMDAAESGNRISPFLLRPGMILDENLRNTEGGLIMRKGQELGEYSVKKLCALAESGVVPESILIQPPAAEE